MKLRFLMRNFFKGLITLAFVSFTQPGFADGVEKDEDQNIKYIGEITITAEKRKEDIQKVPSSITALTDIHIEDAGIKSTFDIDSYVPNFSSYEMSSRVYFSIFNIRGITNTSFGDPALTLYIDDVPTTDFYDFNNSLFDIERIEVLRGPQGTLYGQNTEAGVIKIITKKPGDVLEGSIKTGIGSFNSREVQAGVRGPVIKDKLSLGFSALYNERDGYIENIYNGKDVDHRQTLSARGQIRFTPTSRSDILFTISGEEYDDGGWSHIPKDKKLYKKMYKSPDLDKFESCQDYMGKAELERNSQSLRIAHKFSGFDFVSVTSRKYLDSEDTLDGDFSKHPQFIGFDKNKTYQLSEEIRFSSSEDSGPFNWVAGGFYSTKDNNALTGYMSDMDNGFGYNMPKGTKMTYDADFKATTYAVFGKAGFRFFDDEALGMSAGIRFERAERGMDRDILFAGSKSAPNVDKTQTKNQVLPKFTIDYRFTPELMVFSSVAKGYKAGGFSHAVEDASYVEFDPETVWTYELGLKSRWLNNRLVLNLTGFYSDLNDYQDRVSLDSIRVIQENAADATIFGSEVELIVRPFRGLDITGSFGYLNAEYDDYFEPGTGKDYSGKKITFTPEYEYSLAGQYRTLSGLYFRAELEGNDGFYFDRENRFKEDSRIIVNLKGGYETDHFDFSLSCRNLEDKEYFVSGNDFGEGFIFGNIGAPRTIDFAVTYRY